MTWNGVLMVRKFTSCKFVNFLSPIHVGCAMSWTFLWRLFNSLPNNKILDNFKLKAYADDKNLTQRLEFMGQVENIVGKGENAGYQHFLLFPLCFQKLSFHG